MPYIKIKLMFLQRDLVFVYIDFIDKYEISL